MIFVFLSLLLNGAALFGNPPVRPAAFSEADYAKYDHRTFPKLKAAQQPLELANIDYDLLEAAIFYATNVQRVKAKRKPFAFAPYLRKAAVLHATQMVKRQFFDHQNKYDPKYRIFTQRIDASGGKGKYSSAGENIADSFLLTYREGTAYSDETDAAGNTYFVDEAGKPILPHTYWSLAEAVLEQWMNSPGHRANILDANYTHLGCGSRRLSAAEDDEIASTRSVQVFARAIVP